VVRVRTELAEVVMRMVLRVVGTAVVVAASVVLGRREEMTERREEMAAEGRGEVVALVGGARLESRERALEMALAVAEGRREVTLWEKGAEGEEGVLLVEATWLVVEAAEEISVTGMVLVRVSVTVVRLVVEEVVQVET